MQMFLAHVWGVLSGDSHVRKATTALLAAMLGSFSVAMADGNLTRPESVIALGAGIGAAATVWRSENKH